MQADEKAGTLGTVFAAQWLGYGRVGGSVRLGPIDYPWCTDSLMDAMRAESSMFFMSLLRDNAPIARLIGADYTFVNQELAETLYGMEGIEGSHMRRIALQDPNRGGILGQGSTLAITSNYSKTSPVKRGDWILDAVLGTPPPPPPPDAGVTYRNVCGDPGQWPILEQNGQGVGVIDYDGDGLLDLIFPNGSTEQRWRSGKNPGCRLYRNLGGWRFDDVTRRAGLDDRSWSCGVAGG